MKRHFQFFTRLAPLILVTLLLLTGVRSVFADPPDPVHPLATPAVDGQPQEGATGGAYHNPNDTTVLTPRQKAELQRKHDLIKRLEQLKAAGYSEAEIRQILDLPKKSTDNSLSPNGGTVNYGTTYMGLWKEPESQPNWCGPGSGKAVISNWKTPPSMSYLANEAPRTCYHNSCTGQNFCNGMMTYHCDSQCTDCKWITFDTDWRDIVNHEIGTTWYEIAHPSSVSSYKNILENEIYWLDHPFVNVVHTYGLDGWGWYDTNHYLATNSYSFYSNQLRYGDTAPNSASPAGNPFGWHWRDIDNFYNHLIYNHEVIW